jgi:hypothetical protein
MEEVGPALNLEKRVQPNDIKITVAKKDTDRIIHG